MKLDDVSYTSVHLVQESPISDGETRMKMGFIPRLVPVLDALQYVSTSVRIKLLVRVKSWEDLCLLQEEGSCVAFKKKQIKVQIDE